MIHEAKKKNLRMVIKTVVSPKYEDGMMYLIHSAGLGALNPNTILLTWPQSTSIIYKIKIKIIQILDWKEKPDEITNFLKYVDLSNNLQYHILILKPDEAFNSNF